MPLLDPITNKEELRWRWNLLHMAKALLPTAPITAAIKRSIREYTDEPANECREIYDDGCKYITLNPLPEAYQAAVSAKPSADETKIRHERFCAIWDVIETAGLEQEYETWKEG